MQKICLYFIGKLVKHLKFRHTNTHTNTFFVPQTNPIFYNCNFTVENIFSIHHEQKIDFNFRMKNLSDVKMALMAEKSRWLLFVIVQLLFICAILNSDVCV